MVFGSFLLDGKVIRFFFVKIFWNSVKRIYKCRFHAKGDSKKFKIVEIEEL